VWNKDTVNSFMFSVNQLEKDIIDTIKGSVIVYPVWNGYLIDLLKKNNIEFLGIEYRGAFFDLLDSIYNTRSNKIIKLIEDLDILKENLITDNLLCFNLLNWVDYPSALVNRIINKINAKNYYFSFDLFDCDYYKHNKYINGHNFNYHYFNLDYINKMFLDIEDYSYSIESVFDKCLVRLHKEDNVKKENTVLNENLEKNTDKNDIIKKDSIIINKKKRGVK
jgi:hypothetical protein